MFSLRLTGVSFALIIAVACGSDYSTPPTGPSPTLAPTPGRATSGVAIQAGADAFGTVRTRQRSSTWRSAPASPGLTTIPEGRTADSDAGLEFKSRPASREVLRHIRNGRHVPLSLSIRPGRVGRVTVR